MKNIFEKFLPVHEARPVPGRMADARAERLINKKLNIESLRGHLTSDAFGDGEGAIRTLARLVLELGGARLARYDTILSDDASARLVSLALRKIVDSKKRQLGLKPVNTYFIASGRHDSGGPISEVNKFIVSKGNMGRVLLVSEFIASGRSITSLIRVLEKNGVDFDLAAVSVAGPPSSYEDGIKKHLYYGTCGHAGLNFYSKPQYTGVTKQEIPIAAHPRVLRRKDFSYDARHTDYTSMKNAARHDVNLVAEELAKLVK